jgi:hypothetical protein
MLGIANLAQRGHALDVHQPHFTRRQAHLCPGPFLCHELRADACAAHHLATAAGLELDVVDDRADRDVSESQGIPGERSASGPDESRVPTRTLTGQMM